MEQNPSFVDSKRLLCLSYPKKAFWVDGIVLGRDNGRIWNDNPEKGANEGDARN